MKKKDIAAAIKVSPSTISRELKRNSGCRGSYNWETTLGRKEALKMKTGLSDSTYPNQLKWKTSASRNSATLCRKLTGNQEKN
jgi:IS30 family transposase